MSDAGETVRTLDTFRYSVDLHVAVTDRVGDLALKVAEELFIDDIGLLVQAGFFIAQPGRDSPVGRRGNDPGILNGAGRDVVGSTVGAPVGGAGLGVDRIIVTQDLHQVGVAAVYVGIEQVADLVSGLRADRLDRFCFVIDRIASVQEFDPGDGVRLVVLAAVDQRGLRAGHLQGRDGKLAAADTELDVEVAGRDLVEAHVVHVVDDVCYGTGFNDLLQRLDGSRVQRVAQCITDRDFTAPVAAEVADDEVGARIDDRFIYQRMTGRPAQGLKGRSIVKDRFDRRTRLLVLVDRVVQQQFAALGVVSSAEDRVDRAVFRIDRDRGDFHPFVREFDPFDTFRLDIIHQRLDFRFHIGIDLHRRRVRIGIGQFVHFADDGIDIRLVGISAGRVLGTVPFIDQQVFDLDRTGKHFLFFGDVAVAGHHMQDLVAAFRRLVEEVERVIAVGGVDDACQHRGFREVQLGDALAEIVFRCLFDAADVAVAAEVQLVQVKLEDVALAGLVLQFHRQRDLLDLTGDFLRSVDAGFIVDKVGVLDELHGERGSALGETHRADVVEQRRGETRYVKTVVGEEAGVFDRDERVDQGSRQFVVADVLADRHAEFGDHVAVDIVDDARFLVLEIIDLQLRLIFQVADQKQRARQDAEHFDQTDDRYDDRSDVQFIDSALWFLRFFHRIPQNTVHPGGPDRGPGSRSPDAAHVRAPGSTRRAAICAFSRRRTQESPRL